MQGICTGLASAIKKVCLLLGLGLGIGTPLSYAAAKRIEANPHFLLNLMLNC